MREDILERKDEILSWISEEKPKNFICQQLHCKPETLNSYLKKMGIEYKGQQNKKGQLKGPVTYIPASYYFDNKHPIQSSKLKEKNHYGLAVIRERVGLLEGTFQIVSDNGTKVIVDVPL